MSYPQTAPSRPQAHGPGIAVWALVLAMIPLIASQIAAVVMGIVALSRGALQERRGMAVAALCVSGVWIVVGTMAAALAIGAAEDDRVAGGDDETIDTQPVGGMDDEPDGRDERDVFDLAPGDCTGEIPEGTVMTVPLIPCEQPHVAEVFHQSDLAGGPFPGQEEVERRSDDICFAAFASYVGVAYDDSSLGYFWLSPTKRGWSIERGVTCLVVDVGEVTGSLRDARR